jgi:predicted lysophospholipase L1 biosynthesis ABC-type transport system permease subunit
VKRRHADRRHLRGIGAPRRLRAITLVWRWRIVATAIAALFAAFSGATADFVQRTVYRHRAVRCPDVGRALFAMTRMMPPEVRKVPGGREAIRKSLAELGPMNALEKK